MVKFFHPLLANQVTIAELMTFVRRIMLVTTSKKPDDVYVNHSNAADVSAVDEDVTDISPKKKTDISTIFHEVVFLLLCFWQMYTFLIFLFEH